MHQKKKKISNWDYVLETPLFFLLPKCLSSKDCACQCRRHKRCGFNPWVKKIPLEKKMAIHSRILAWEIPWTEEPSGLQSGHDWAYLHSFPCLYLFSEVIASAWSKPAYLTFSASHFAQGSLIAYVLSQNHEVWTREKINIFHIFKCSCSIMSTFFCQYWWY